MATPAREEISRPKPVVAFPSTREVATTEKKTQPVGVYTCCATARRLLVGLWYASQVEFWGQYSVERMLALDVFSRTTRKRRVLALLIGTFLPCLLVEMALEIIPLSPTRLGLAHSRNFWIRTTLMTYIITHALVAQYQQNIPALALSTRNVIVISTVTSVAVQPLLYVMATYIGYPIPFFMVLTLAPWTPLVVTMAGFILRYQLRQDANVRSAIVHFSMVFNAQAFLIVVYPAYSYVFNRLPNQQTWFVLVLPVMKILFRNLFSHACRHNHDLKPELVVFNVEIFSALYLSSCMQSATTIYSTVVIMIVDFLHAALSIKDLADAFVDSELRRVIGEEITTRQLIPLAQHVLQTSSFVLRHKSIQLDTSASKRFSFEATAQLGRAKIVPKTIIQRDVDLSPTEFSKPIAQQGHDHTTTSKRPTNDTARRTSVFSRLDTFLRDLDRRQSPDESAQLERIASGLSDNDKLIVVQKTLRTLHIAEFVALVEYSEVIVPLVYSLFMIVAYAFPNRQFYSNLKDLDPYEFAGTLGNVLLYGSLELVSYVMLNVVLERKFHLSAFTQTAFVLDTQWAMVQSKLLLWLMVVLQFAHEHYGCDFSFHFKWLHQAD